jgi:hypothetical protein
MTFWILLAVTLLIFGLVQMSEAGTLRKRLGAALEELERLRKYEKIIDVENEVSQMRSSAETEAKNLRATAKSDAEKIKESAKAKEKMAEETLIEATESAKRVILEAEQKAEEIAGNAIEAKKNAELYSETAKAMKNIIEGYGDRYLISASTLIDGLAEEYGHTQAGDDLKKIRVKVKQAIKDETAATCKYAEEVRRRTAINFILDAFNGKVDSVLSDVKAENYGTLAQKINDAFQTVNFNGKAFRDAEINKEYLALRLEELRLASLVQALKDKDREEQRALREQIREEEKAKKEYERAIRDAEKEEAMLNKALEKARKEIETATTAKRTELEAKLAELQAQIQAQEVEKQRAISMAQVTKSGYVYVISNIGSFGENVYKIGMTRRYQPQDRIDELGDASVPFDFDVHAMFRADDAPALEKSLHKKFVMSQINKVNARKEFFKIELADIRKCIDDLGIQAKWTMTAEAREYHESRKIEEDMKANALNPEAWKRSMDKEIDALKLGAEEVDHQ